MISQDEAPVILARGERMAEYVFYLIVQDHVSAQEPDFTVSWHFVYISKPERQGRFVIWRSPDMRLFYVPLATKQDGQHLLRKLKKEYRSDKRGFALQDVPDAALVQNISARDAFSALEDISKKMGTPCPDRLSVVSRNLPFLALVGFTALGLWSIVSGGTLKTGVPLLNHPFVVLFVTALLAQATHLRKHLPRLRHLHFVGYRLERGIDWAPTAVTCDASGMEIWREGKVLCIGWPMVRAVHSENYLTVIEMTDDQVFVVPEIPTAASLLAAHRTARGLGPRNETRRASLPKQGKRKRWSSFLINGLVWFIIFVVVFGLIGLLQAKPAAAEMLRESTLPVWYKEVSPQERKAALAVHRPVNHPLFDEKIRVEEDGYQTVRQGFFVVHDRTSLEDFDEIRLTVDPNFERAAIRLRMGPAAVHGQHRAGRNRTAAS
ncbi:hypothetical protein RUE5091_04165 [Ruegeria denitrificans]|uniref:Uncharacterized protein n=1 Tax=Ruegeria denitrificans TaxID=1715692 RepID=A0A0P1IJX8_9RHOB|nr:hypothetical protein [Ruegeria denitrificans]CUK17817.1 hypothetical protein RUE5091_04165 [Ruegeria denitrificans]